MVKSRTGFGVIRLVGPNWISTSDDIGTLRRYHVVWSFGGKHSHRSGRFCDTMRLGCGLLRSMFMPCCRRSDAFAIPFGASFGTLRRHLALLPVSVPSSTRGRDASVIPSVGLWKRGVVLEFSLVLCCCSGVVPRGTLWRYHRTHRSFGSVKSGHSGGCSYSLGTHVRCALGSGAMKRSRRQAFLNAPLSCPSSGRSLVSC